MVLSELAIPVDLFSRAVRSVKNTLSNDKEYRKQLQYIHIKVTNEELSFFSCNGFIASRYTVPMASNIQKTADALEFNILPFPVNKKLFPTAKVVIQEYDDNTTRVLVPTHYGKVEYILDPLDAAYPVDLDKVFAGKPEDKYTEIGANPGYVSHAMSSFVDVKAVQFSVPDNPIHPILLKGSTLTGERIDAVVLPVRLIKKE